MPEFFIDFLQYTIDGALKGMLYALIALSFVVIYRAGRIFNFAQGEILVLGGYFVFTFCASLALPLWLGLGIAILGMAAVGVVIERGLFRPMIGQELFSIIMVTIALVFILQGSTIVLWGGMERPFPPVFQKEPILAGPFILNRSIFLGGILSLGLIALLFFLFERTRWGLTLTAVAEEHKIAQSLGISVRKAIAIGWAISCILSLVAAIIFLNGQAINFTASIIGMQALPVALLAGVESIWGTPLAGLIVGLGEAWAVYFLDPYTGGASSRIFPYLLMLVILLIRPYGLFGWKTIERV
jgi:branched-chain amino acid transport system permease protein